MYLLASTLMEIPLNASLILIKRAVATSSSQFIKILALNDVALVLCQINHQQSYTQLCKQLRLDATWGYILSCYQVRKYWQTELNCRLKFQFIYYIL